MRNVSLTIDVFVLGVKDGLPKAGLSPATNYTPVLAFSQWHKNRAAWEGT